VKLYCVDNADNIDPKNVTITNGTEVLYSVWIRWNEPLSPNGLIVLYDVELTRVDVANVSQVMPIMDA